MKIYRIVNLVVLCLYSYVTNASLHVPEGFEELARPQTVLVDVSLYGSSLGVFLIQEDLESIRFLKPEILALSITKIYPDTPVLNKLLKNELGKRFNRNGNISCGSSGDIPGCDFLSTETINLIYDENNARVLLFIGANYLSKKKKDSIYYNASEESRNALIHQQNINFVADNRYQLASIQGNGTLGITGNGYLNVDWNWQGQRFSKKNIQNVNLNNIYIRQDIMKRVYLQAGVMDSRDIFSNAGGNINLSQLPLGKIRGVRAGSTLAWVNMNKVLQSTPVNIFLSRDARVEAWRDVQLLGSFYLKSGVQELDSSLFPQGSYLLTLRIYEDNQLARTESLHYTNLGTASPSTLQWFIQGGAPDMDITSGDPDRQVFQAGARLPVSNNVALTVGAALFSNAHFQEGAIDWSHKFNSGWIDGLLASRASYLYGSEGSRGSIQQVSYNNGFSLSFYRSAMTAADCITQNIHPYSFTGCYKSLNLMLAVPFHNWYGTLGYSVSSNQGRYVYRRELTSEDPHHQNGVPWEKVWQTHSRSATWQAGITRTFNVSGININADLNMFLRDGGSTDADKGLFASLSFSGSQNDIAGTRGTYSAGLNWRNRHAGYNAAYNQYTDGNAENQTGVSLDGMNTDTIMSSAYGRLAGQYGTASLTVSDTWGRVGNKHVFSSGGNYSSSLAIDRQGFAFGRWGDGSPSSAISVGVEQSDESDKSKVSISVEGSGRSDVGGNRRALFAVPGYRETVFEAMESPASLDGINSEISKGSGTRRVFMTPGKVFNTQVGISARYTWLGKLIDDNHRPLVGVIPLNVASWTPLGGGSFNFETTKKIRMLYVMKGDVYWQCGMNVNMVRDVIRYVGVTTCQNTELVNLPSAEQRQVELMTVGVGGQEKTIAMSNDENVFQEN